MRNVTRGFTLIEILVSIAIISILAGVLYANFGSAREDAKNKSVQTEVKETQLAIELYKAQYGRYPEIPTGSVPGGCTSSVSGVDTSNSVNCGSVEYISGLTPDFIAELPNEADSGNETCVMQYQVDSTNGSWYKLTAINCHSGAVSAAEGGVTIDSDFARCPTSCASCTDSAISSSTAAFYESYAVYSAGGECR